MTMMYIKKLPVFTSSGLGVLVYTIKLLSTFLLSLFTVPSSPTTNLVTVSDSSQPLGATSSDKKYVPGTNWNLTASVVDVHVNSLPLTSLATLPFLSLIVSFAPGNSLFPLILLLEIFTIIGVFFISTTVTSLLLTFTLPSSDTTKVTLFLFKIYPAGALVSSNVYVPAASSTEVVVFLVTQELIVAPLLSFITKVALF